MSQAVQRGAKTAAKAANPFFDNFRTEKELKEFTLRNANKLDKFVKESEIRKTSRIVRQEKILDSLELHVKTRLHEAVSRSMHRTLTQSETAVYAYILTQTISWNKVAFKTTYKQMSVGSNSRLDNGIGLCTKTIGKSIRGLEEKGAIFKSINKLTCVTTIVVNLEWEQIVELTTGKKVNGGLKVSKKKQASMQDKQDIAGKEQDTPWEHYSHPPDKNIPPYITTNITTNSKTKTLKALAGEPALLESEDSSVLTEGMKEEIKKVEEETTIDLDAIEEKVSEVVSDNSIPDAGKLARTAAETIQDLLIQGKQRKDVAAKINFSDPKKTWEHSVRFWYADAPRVLWTKKLSGQLRHIIDRCKRANLDPNDFLRKVIVEWVSLTNQMFSWMDHKPRFPDIPFLLKHMTSFEHFVIVENRDYSGAKGNDAEMAMYLKRGMGFEEAVMAMAVSKTLSLDRKERREQLSRLSSLYRQNMEAEKRLQGREDAIKRRENTVLVKERLIEQNGGLPEGLEVTSRMAYEVLVASKHPKNNPAVIIRNEEDKQVLSNASRKYENNEVVDLVSLPTYEEAFGND